MNQKQERLLKYEDERAAIQVKFQKERNSELADCERRRILCNNSFAKRKYEPIFEELEKVYFADIFVFSEEIRSLQAKIIDIRKEEAERQEKILLDRTPEEIQRDIDNRILEKTAEENLEKAQGYFENMSFDNAKIFFEKSCVIGVGKIYKCYYGLAQTQAKLKDFRSALEYYEYALAKALSNQEEVDAIAGINKMKKLLTTFERLDELLFTFHANIDTRFDGKERILKQNFYDDLITKLRVRLKETPDGEFASLIEYVIDSMTFARRKVTQEINDIYN